MGPVQVLVVGFDEPAFSGEVLAEFARLREAGIVRLVDVLLVRRAEDGTLETLGAPETVAADLGRLAAALLGSPDGDADDADVAEAAANADPIGAPVWSLADAVPPGSAAAVALIEHVWAGPLTTAIRRAGGRALEETWLAADDRTTLENLTAGRPAGRRPTTASAEELG
jgi:hypothetical protein